MKISFLALLLVSFVTSSCTSSSNNISKQGPPLPDGATQQPYVDNPEMVKAWIGDQASPQEQGTYFNGTRQGTWSTFYPNGLVQTLSGYVNGKKEGVEATIDDTGRLVLLIAYHEGMPEGLYRKFNGNKIKEERTYSNGQLMGDVRIYYDNGKVMEESTYLNGKRHGMARWYDQEGNMSIEYQYDQGELVKPDSL